MSTLPSYFRAGDTNPTTQVWELATGQFVANNVASYLAWIAAGGAGAPRTVTNAQNNGAGLIRLTLAGDGVNNGGNIGMTTGEAWVAQNVGGTIEADGTWLITTVGATQVDLQGSAFVNPFTSGGVVDSAPLVATAAGIFAEIDTQNQLLLPTLGATINLAGGTVALSLPLALILDVNCMAPGTLKLPQMNLLGSPGLDRLLILNNTGSAAFVLRDFGNTLLLSSVAAGDVVLYWNEANATVAGTIRGQTLQNISTVGRGGTGVGSLTARAILQSGSSGLQPVDSADLAAGTAGNIPIDQGAGNAWLSKSVSGDVTLASSGVATLASTIAAAGPIGDASHVAQITYDAKGRLTAVLGVGIAIPASSLTDYATGAWTPTDASVAGLSFTSVTAQYTKIGNMVFAYGRVTYPVTADTHSALIGSLPVAVPNQDYASNFSPVTTTAGLAFVVMAQPTKNTSQFALLHADSRANVTNVQLSGATVAFNLVYPAS